MQEVKSINAAFKNDLAEVSRLGEVVDDFGLKNNLPSSITNAVNLALDELITNTISYGYSDSSEHQILLDLKVKIICYMQLLKMMVVLLILWKSRKWILIFRWKEKQIGV